MTCVALLIRIHDKIETSVWQDSYSIFILWLLSDVKFNILCEGRDHGREGEATGVRGMRPDR